jgi:hypothetical protein
MVMHPASDSGTTGTGIGNLIAIKLSTLCPLALISLILTTDQFLLLRGPLSSDLDAQHILLLLLVVVVVVLLLLQTICVPSLN